MTINKEIKNLMQTTGITKKDILTIRERYRRTAIPIDIIVAEFGLTVADFDVLKKNCFSEVERGSEQETDPDELIWVKNFLKENWHWKDAEKCRKHIALNTVSEQEIEKEDFWNNSQKRKWLKENWHFQAPKKHPKKCTVYSAGRTFFVQPKITLEQQLLALKNEKAKKREEGEM